MLKKLNCPACGAPLRIDNRFVKLVTCEFCGQVSLLRDTGLDPTGRTAQLAEFPSPLYLDATGILQGKRFRVLGRLRYQYAAGFWDEWFLYFENDKPGWLVEDEGEFTFYNKTTFTGPIPPFETIQVGGTIQLNGRSVFITERGTAVIAGGEGQLAFQVLPGEQIHYFDGTCEGRMLTVEYADDEIEVLVGRAIERNSLIIDEE